MPSGHTHDRITIWSIPAVASATLILTRSSNVTLLVAGGFMFAGLMFGPDLDIYSRQFQRWGFLRWIWLPYQKSLRHRSFLSHGLIIGTTLRVVYLTTFLGFVGILVLVIFAKLGNVALNWGEVWGTAGRTISIYYGEFLALFLGCELGAMSHSFSDWTGSAYKRFQKQGVRGLLPSGKIKKPKVNSRGKRSSQSRTNKSRTKS
jgi:uncharacterized metal-binding protein